MADYNSSKTSNKGLINYICYGILLVIILLIILTVFNMDLFMTYFSDMGTSSSFGAFIGRFGDYIVALFRHTFDMF